MTTQPVRLTKGEVEGPRAAHAMRAALAEQLGVVGRRVVAWRRLPLTLAYVLLHAPIGAVRACVWVWRWVNLGEAAPFREATKGDPLGGGDAWLRHRNEQRKTREERIDALKVVAVVAVVGAVVVGATAPRILLAAAAARFVWLGWYGWTWRHEPRELLSTYETAGEAPPISHAEMVRAFGKLKIADLNAALKENPDHAIRWVGPGISRDNVAGGTLVQCHLPAGVLGSDVMMRRDKLASALSRPLGCTWVSIDPEEQPGFVEIWIPDKNLNRMRQPPWPYLRGGRADYFEPVQLGTDQMGRPVLGILDQSGSLVAGQSGFGKSSASAVLLYYSALDPTVEHWIVDLAGKGDWTDARAFASRFVEGQGDEHAEAALYLLRDLRAEVKRRSDILRGLPVEVRGNEVRVTRATADSVPGLHPLHFFADECQELFGHPDRNLSREARKLAIDVSKLGRACAVHTQWATQQPTQDSFPVPLRNNVRLRACFRVVADGTSALILGDDAADSGISATQFTIRDLGISWVVGPSSHDAQPTVARWHFLDSDARRRLAARARSLREQRGLLRGLAAGIEPEPRPDVEARDILRDVCEVSTARDKMWTENLLALLGERWPGRYGGWTPEQLAEELRPFGATSKDVRDVPLGGGSSAPRKGYDIAPLRALLHERDAEID